MDSVAETKLPLRLAKSFTAFRQGSGIPPWLVSDSSIAMFICQSDKWVQLLPPIGFGQTLSCLCDRPEIEQMSLENLTEESKKWAERNQIRDALLAVFNLLTFVNELQCQNKLSHKTTVLKTLPVLGVIFWCPEGSEMVAQAAKVLGCTEATPVHVFESYRRAIESGDEAALLGLERIVDNDPVFNKWTHELSVAAGRVSLPNRTSSLPCISQVSTALLAMLETEVKGDNN